MGEILVPHPIPYQGSKRSLALRILSFFPKNVETFYEPFAGSAAISLAAATRGKAKQYYLNDLNAALIDLWETIINKPEALAAAYDKIWSGQEKAPIGYYEAIREEFNKSKRPHYFLFLLVRCVKAAVRYNSKGGFNQSADKRRMGTNPITMRQQIHYPELDVQEVLNISFAEHLTQDGDFGQATIKAINEVNENDLVYMDPPYQGVSGNRDSRYFASIQFDEFVESLHELDSRKIRYIVSYDGRTGKKVHGKHLPESLGAMHLELPAGRSTQSTLLGREDETFESLYLSRHLVNQLRHQGLVSFSVPLEKQLEFSEAGA